jgi:hypothetical protein
MFKSVATSLIPATAALFMAFGSSAEAATVKFYNGGTGYSGDFSGAGTVYNATEGLSTTCPTTGSCSVDNIQTTETFNLAGGLSLTATASDTNVTGVKAWDDLTPNFGGMGVGTGNTGGDQDDNINGTNILKLTFSSPITLTGVATLFDSAHGPFGNGSPTNGTTGFFLLDGVKTSFSSANDNLLSITGTVFTFEEDTSSDPTFYVSALDYSATPLPAAFPLFATGLGAIGLLGWRRKRKAAAAIEAA